MTDTTTTTGPGAGPGSAADDPMLDEEWLAAPARRSRARTILLAVLVASVVFLGGVLTQKYLGGTDTAATAGPAGGFPGGGQLPDGGGFPGGDAGGFPGAGTGQDQQDSRGSGGGTTADDDGTDAVIGTVVTVRGDVWVVEDLGGNRHRIRITDDSDLVREQDLDPADVAAGDGVDISGTTDGDDLVAQDVTVR